MKLHPKIQELKLRSRPVNETRAYVDAKGNLVDLQVRADADSRTIEGYLAVWNVKDTYGTMFMKGSASKSIRDRGPGSESKYKITLLWMHRQDEPLGRFTELREDDYGLYFKAVLDDIPTADRALKQIRSGTINQFSIGFDYVWDKMEYDEETESIMIMEIELFEGSVVTMGSNSETYAIRSVEQYSEEKDLLDEETEEFIKSVPRRQRLELRQLIARHISLAKTEPDELSKRYPLGEGKPDEREGLKIDQLIKSL